MFKCISLITLEKQYVHVLNNGCGGGKVLSLVIFILVYWGVVKRVLAAGQCDL